MTPYYDEDGITIYHADCREVLPTLSGDVVLTDPPYGNGTAYDSYDDSEESLAALVADTLPMMVAVAPVVLLTPGVANLWRYPRPKWVLSWVTPAGAGSGPWGFSCWQPVLAYGPDPYLRDGLGRRPDTLIKTEPASETFGGHPCAKPIGVWRWFLERASTRDSDTILDPFMGSGTTLRAAKDLGRKAIGVEVEERYCEIAVQRLAQGVLAL